MNDFVKLRALKFCKTCHCFRFLIHRLNETEFEGEDKDEKQVIAPSNIEAEKGVIIALYDSYLNI